jgi:hypothetical protein
MRITFFQVLACAMTVAAGSAIAQQQPACALPYSKTTWTNCIGQRTAPNGENYAGSF